MTYKIEVDDGKYTFINNNGVVGILRNGEIWGSGNKAILALLQKVQQYEKALEEITRQYDNTSVNRAKEIANEVLGELTDERRRHIQN